MKIYVLWHTILNDTDYEVLESEGAEGYYCNIDDARKDLKEYYDEIKLNKDGHLNIVKKYTHFTGKNVLTFREKDGTKHKIKINTITTKD